MDGASNSSPGLQISEQGGVALVRLTPEILGGDHEAEIRSRIRTLSTNAELQGLILDCRDLPQSAAPQIKPVLYELVVLCRRRIPPLDVCVVGKPGQTTGGSDTFLAPRRFETLEAAAALLHAGQPGHATLRVGRGGVSDQPVPTLTTRPNFWQTTPGQALLTVAVVGLSCALVAYSAVASFTPPVMPRRHTTVPTARLAIRGSVMVVNGKSLKEDPAAVILAWPAALANTKYDLALAHVLSGARPPHAPAIIFAPAGDDGQFAIWRGQLAGDAQTEYCLLAISRNVARRQAVGPADRQRLAQAFVEPSNLLGDRQYALRLATIRPDDVTDQVFVFGADGEQDVASLSKDPEAAATVQPGPAADERAEQVP